MKKCYIASGPDKSAHVKYNTDIRSNYRACPYKRTVKPFRNIQIHNPFT